MTGRDADIASSSPRMCVVLDRVRAKAAAGNQAALEFLARYAPRDATRAMRRELRDQHIRHIATWLRGLHPGVRRDAVAHLIAAAGAAVTSGRGLSDRSLFSNLTTAEREHLQSSVHEALAESGGSWPGWRQITRIILS